MTARRVQVAPNRRVGHSRRRERDYPGRLTASFLAIPVSYVAYIFVRFIVTTLLAVSSPSSHTPTVSTNTAGIVDKPRLRTICRRPRPAPPRYQVPRGKPCIHLRSPPACSTQRLRPTLQLPQQLPATHNLHRGATPIAARHE